MKKLPYILLIIVAGVGLAIGGVMLVDHLGKDKYGGRRLVTELPENPVWDKVVDISRYKSSDLQMQLAKGNVKRINETSYSPNGIYQIDKESCIIHIKRNEKGQIIEILDSERWDDGDFVNEDYYYYTYDNNGFLKELTHTFADGVEGEYHESYTHYTYSGDNLIKAETRSWADVWLRRGDGIDDAKIVTTTITIYSNYKYDSHGNWISREVKEETNSNIYELDEQYGNIKRFVKEENYSNSDTETRTITYYD
jgi:hypothetical protein